MDVFSRQSPLLAPQNHQRFLPILDLDGLAGSQVRSRRATAALPSSPLRRRGKSPFSQPNRFSSSLTIHRTPSAEAAQSPLKPVKRSLEILHEFFHKPETVRAWLNTPHPDLDGRSALEMILASNPIAVLRILESAAAGVPV